jgi:tRNA(Ile)-lysidine synthase
LPTLADYNPQIIARLDSLSRVVDADESLLASILDEYWPDLTVDESRGQITLNLEQWRALPLAMRRRTLRRAARLLPPPENDIGFEVIELARDVAEKGESGDRAMLPGGVELVIEYSRLIVKSPESQHDSEAWPQLADDEVCHLPVPGRLQLPGEWRIVTERVRIIDFDQIIHNEDPWRAYISVAFADELIIRPRQVGERLRPLGMGGRSRKLGDIMSDRKIPERYRARWPLLASSEHGLWLPGHIVDERARVKPDDSETLLVKVEHSQSVD